MSYTNKQYKAKLSTWYICNRLGLNYKEYIDVRTGRKNLAGDKLDLFNELTDVRRQEFINQKEEERKINEWYSKQTKETIEELINSFKIKKEELAEDLGTSYATLNRVLKDLNYDCDVKYLMYYYLHDENNRRNEFKVSNKRKLDNKVFENYFGIADAKDMHIEETTEETPNEEGAKASFVPPIPDEITLGCKSVAEEEPTFIGSFISKQDYDKKVKELDDANKELERFRYLIDQIMSK